MLQLDDADGVVEDDEISHRYLWGDAVDELFADEQVSDTAVSGEVLWPLTDNLGSIRDIVEYNAATDTTTITNHITYDSFGQVVSETNSAVDLLFGYTGRALDEYTTLQNNLNRWYDARTGRWISNDPIGFTAGDANLYRYVGNQSTTYVDPDGLEEEEGPEEGHTKKTPAKAEGHTGAMGRRKRQFMNKQERRAHEARRRAGRAERARLFQQAVKNAKAANCDELPQALKIKEYDRLQTKLANEAARLKGHLEKVQGRQGGGKSAETIQKRLSLIQRLTKTVRGLDWQARPARRLRGGFINPPQINIPLAGARAKGAAAGAGPMLGLVFGEMALSALNDKVGGAIGHCSDNILGDGRNFGTLMGRLFGEDRRFHWNHVHKFHSNTGDDGYGGEFYTDSIDSSEVRYYKAGVIGYRQDNGTMLIVYPDGRMKSVVRLTGSHY